MVFDLSDENEYEDAVNLGSPDPPEGKSDPNPKESKKLLVIRKPDLIILVIYILLNVLIYK